MKAYQSNNPQKARPKNVEAFFAWSATMSIGTHAKKMKGVNDDTGQAANKSIPQMVLYMSDEFFKCSVLLNQQSKIKMWE